MRAAHRRPSLACAAVLALCSPAAAEPELFGYTLDPRAMPDHPAPPSIPDLTHRGIWLGFEQTWASIKPKDAITGPQDRSFAWVGRAEVEAMVGRSRRWFVGAATEAAYGKPPGGTDGRLLSGYPELWGRAAWSDRTGLTYGGGVSLVVPAWRRGASSADAAVAEGVRVVRPWDFPAFADNTFTGTPFLDARVVDGRVTMQLRQGFSFQGLVAEARIPTANLVSRTTLYLGYQPIDELGLGLEVWEVYFLSADLPDNQRAAFALSPSVRLLTRTFQPALSLIVPYDRPLFDRVESYWAVRLTFGATLDTAQPAPATGVPEITPR